MSRESGPPDSIISAVLDILIDITQWSPESIWPEHSLQDLEMTEAQVHEFFLRLNDRIPSEKPVDVSSCSKLSLREIVSRVREQQQTAA